MGIAFSIALYLIYTFTFQGFGGKSGIGGAAGVGTAAGVSTPGFVRETGKPTTITTYNGNSTALGTNPVGQTACPDFSYCVPLPDPALSGNLIIAPYSYNNSTNGAVTTTGVAATVAQSGSTSSSDALTCVDGTVDASTHQRNGICYGSNITAGRTRAVITFGTSPVTNVAGKAAEFYNIATSSPLDSSAQFCAGASTTTANCASVTTTAGNDLIYVMVCRVGTPSNTSFTAGSGFVLSTVGNAGSTDSTDGLPNCASEWKVAASIGSITPSMTMASASTYIELLVAFKTASAGTAPTGMYAERAMSWSTDQSRSATSWGFQFPSSGNLLTLRIYCGGTIQPSSSTVPSDAGQTNPWVFTGLNNLNTPAGFVGEYYLQAASVDSTGLITVTTSGTGDCTFLFESWAGGPVPTFTNWAAFTGNQSGNNVTVTTSFLPYASTYLLLEDGTQATNTQAGVAFPSSGCVPSDAGFFGGMNVNGPEPLDENNPAYHCMVSSTGVQTETYINAGTNSNGEANDIITFLAPGGVGIVQLIQHQNGDAACTYSPTTDLHCTIPAPAQNDAVMVLVGIYNSTPRTATAVCLAGNSTCGTGTQLSTASFSNAITTGTAGQGATSVWFLSAAPTGSPTTLDVIASNTTTHIEFAYYVLEKGSGGSFAADTNLVGAKVQNGSSSGTTVTGGTVTTTGAVDFCAAIVTVSSSVNANPHSGNEFIYPGIVFSNTNDAATSLITTSASAHTPVWDDTSGTFNSSMGCIK